MKDRFNLIGKKFGRLIVIGSHHKIDKSGCRYWICKCHCGKEIIIRGANLMSGHTRSCKCLRIESFKKRITKHEMCKTKVYRTWRDMKSRCNNPNSKEFHNYGERNIKICRRWYKFEDFYKDIRDPPSKKHSINRIDNDGDYCPGNCEWATPKQQANNRRNNRTIKYKNKKFTIKELSKIIHLRPQTLYGRIKDSNYIINNSIFLNKKDYRKRNKKQKKEILT